MRRIVANRVVLLGRPFPKPAGRISVSVVSAQSTEYLFPFETISDTPIFNALAATSAPFSRSVATPGGSAALSRSCVMPRSPRAGGGRHHRLSSHAEHGGGRHRLMVAHA
jgi:hypothetical protein